MMCIYITKSIVHISKGLFFVQGCENEGGGLTVKPTDYRSDGYEFKPQHCQADTLGTSSKAPLLCLF